MIEATIATLITGGMLVAAVSTVGSSARAGQITTDRGLGMQLAQQLMSEILPLAYEEPEDTPGFGRETGEGADSRANYDDLDDYNGWSSSPPEEKDGTAMSDLVGWQRDVTVAYTRGDDLTATEGAEMGLRRITVTVSHGGVDAATLVAVRAIARDYAEPE
jgi:hypothetical protein